MGMKQILLMMAAVVLVGCSNETPETSQAAEAEPQVASKPTPEPTPVSPVGNKLIADPIVETAVRENLKKPEGELTKAELAKVTRLNLGFTKITDEGLKDVAKLENLKGLSLNSTQVTDVGLKDVAKLQNLIAFGLFRTKITKAGVAELKKALPNILIYGP